VTALAAGVLLAGWAGAAATVAQLHAAAAQGDGVVVLEMVQAGSDPNGLLGEAAQSPLMTAAMYGKTEVIRALLRSHARVDQRDASGATALLKTSYPPVKGVPLGDLSRAAGALLDGHADPNAADENGWRPVIGAAAACNRKLVAILLKAGADARKENAAGASALRYALLCKDAKISTMLQDSGAY
jgi:ankyrin repeat protein